MIREMETRGRKLVDKVEAKRAQGAGGKMTNVERERKVGERRRKIVREMEGGDAHWRWGWLVLRRNHGERRERPLDGEDERVRAR